MRISPTSRPTLALLLLSLALPALVLADEPDNKTKKDRQPEEEESTVVIRGDDGEELTMTIADGALTVVATEDGETTTSVVDLEAMGLVAGDAVEEALAEGNITQSNIY